MKILSQRDDKWAGVQLGTSNKTIGSHGCTVTCLAMASDLTPDQVNERLNRVNGYASGNLVIWAKIKEAIPWMEFEWRGYSYDNDKVSAAIAKNGFCLVEVDGSRIGGTKHWVLYIGGGQMYDPWYGTQKATSYYSATGYAVINKIGEPESTMYRGLDLSNSESMKVCVDDHMRIVDGELVPKKELDETKQTIERLQGEKGQLQSQIKTLGADLGTVRADLATAMGKIEADNKVIATYVNEDAVQLQTLKTAENERTAYKNFIQDTLVLLEGVLKLPTGSDSKEVRISAISGALESLNQTNILFQECNLEREALKKRLVLASKHMNNLSIWDKIVLLFSK